MLPNRAAATIGQVQGPSDMVAALVSGSSPSFPPVAGPAPSPVSGPAPPVGLGDAAGQGTSTVGAVAEALPSACPPDQVIVAVLSRVPQNEASTAPKISRTSKTPSGTSEAGVAKTSMKVATTASGARPRIFRANKAMGSSSPDAAQPYPASGGCRE